MAAYALIEDGEVVNTIVWDGPERAPIDFGEGVSYVEIPEKSNNYPSIGWGFKDGFFVAPSPTEQETEEVRAEKTANNIATKESLMSIVTQKINILQDAVDLNMANEEESKALPPLKKYRILLSRIDANTDTDITWPEMPK